MQLILDFLPVIAFFVAYKLGGIYLATKTLMAAMPLLCLVTWLRTRKISGMLLTSTVLALAAGGVTLALHDPMFVKWKLTLLDGIFALAFLVAPYLGGKTLVERVMGSNITLEPRQWRILNWMWVGFFLFTASINVYVLYHFSEAAWVNFKLYGTLGLTLVFVVMQAFWLADKLPKEPANAEDSANDPRQMNGS
ncbi:MAG TPA: septation protein A [Steroidobacteraceae bacterium]|nr:septation protein A [Steroidobacteraceae bacterium]